MGAIGASLWGVVGVLVLLALVFVTGRKANAQDLVVLSHRFDDNQFSSKIIGEIMNNDTRSYDKYDVSIYANFRDPAGALVSSEQGFIDAESYYELLYASSKFFCISFTINQIRI